MIDTELVEITEEEFLANFDHYFELAESKHVLIKDKTDKGKDVVLISITDYEFFKQLESDDYDNQQ